MRAGRPPLVTILINNYNYARFLNEAIDSALDQTYPHTEVIVVDDGSTDGSREILAAYGDRIRAVLKENGGQGSTLNAGFGVSQGDIICLLDADDGFFPEKAARVAAAWTENPQATLVYHQLQHVDTRKRRLGNPWPRSVWRGDIRDKVERSGGWWPKPTTSGLCCSRSFLERVLPIPEASYKLAMDAYINGLAPFLGPVTGIQAPLAFYRIHEQNYYHARGPKERLERLALEFQMLEETLHERLGLPVSISLEDNLRYHQYRSAAGEPGVKFKALIVMLKTPTLPLVMKVREVIKLVLNMS